MSVELPDGEMPVHVAIPKSGSGPAVLVLHELFGVNAYIRGVGERLAADGYVALVPDLFWRVESGLVFANDRDGARQGMATAKRIEHAAGTADLVAALDAARSLPEVTGEVGVLGFCMGGSYAFDVAIHGTPDVAVCYYGSTIARSLPGAGEISCPTLLQFGGQDRHIPREDIDRIAAVAASHPTLECRIHEEAGHAFDNSASPAFHQPEAAARAWQITSEFLARALSV